MASALRDRYQAEMDKLQHPERLWIEVFKVIAPRQQVYRRDGSLGAGQGREQARAPGRVLYNLCGTLRVAGILLNAYLPTTPQNEWIGGAGRFGYGDG